MLERIRRGADSFFVRIVLGMIVFAFVGWGIKDVLQARNNFDLVTFSNAKNITDSDFLKAKAEEINRIQRQTNTNLLKEDIARLGVDRVVLGRLVNDRILEHIADIYGLNISDEMVIELVKNSPVFKNNKGEFDLDIFKAAFRNSYSTEEEYLEGIKSGVIKNNLLSVFLESYRVPNVLVKNIVNYMAETRSADIAEIDLKAKSMELSLNPTEAELEAFYNSNQILFTLPEQRDINYIKVPSLYLAKNISLSDDDLHNFFNENKDHLGLKDFNKDKNQVREGLMQQKIAEMVLDFGKNLEDEVAAGSSLKEIADKYELTISSAKGLSKESLESDKLFKEISDIIFDLTEGELSYPIEIKSNQEIILLEIASIAPAKLQELETVKAKALKLWSDEKVSEANVKILEEMARNYKGEKDAKAPSGVKIKEVTLSRNDLGNSLKIPKEVFLAVFQTEANKNTPVFVAHNRAYFAHIKDIKVDAKKASKIAKESGSGIESTIRNSALEELLGYFIRTNNMQINHKDRVLDGE